MTRAEVMMMMLNPSYQAVQDMVQKALGLEQAVRDEENPLYALRQWVRVLRKTGEIYGKLGYTGNAEARLQQALGLARQTNAKDQVSKIEQALSNLSKPK